MTDSKQDLIVTEPRFLAAIFAVALPLAGLAFLAAVPGGKTTESGRLGGLSDATQDGIEVTVAFLAMGAALPAARDVVRPKVLLRLSSHGLVVLNGSRTYVDYDLSEVVSASVQELDPSRKVSIARSNFSERRAFVRIEFRSASPIGVHRTAPLTLQEFVDRLTSLSERQ